MIIWRGWGILTILMVGAGMGLAAVMAPLMGGTESGLWAAVGLILGAAGTYLVGNHLNQVKPRREMDAYLGRRAYELDQAVESGRFSLNGIRPTSLEEARAQAQWLMDSETQQLKSKTFNAHTLFFVPMQYFSFILAGLGVVVFITSVIALF